MYGRREESDVLLLQEDRIAGSELLREEECRAQDRYPKEPTKVYIVA